VPPSSDDTKSRTRNLVLCASLGILLGGAASADVASGGPQSGLALAFLAVVGALTAVCGLLAASLCCETYLNRAPAAPLTPVAATSGAPTSSAEPVPALNIDLTDDAEVADPVVARIPDDERTVEVPAIAHLAPVVGLA
jgi:hypothetical protein